jgi:hypothetical protein
MRNTIAIPAATYWMRRGRERTRPVRAGDLLRRQGVGRQRGQRAGQGLLVGQPRGGQLRVVLGDVLRQLLHHVLAARGVEGQGREVSPDDRLPVAHGH